MFSAKAAIAICEKRLECDFEAVPFNLRGRYQPKHADVARYNPKGQVPVLFDGEIVVYDSTQIFEYLEDAYPTPPLWPEDTKRKVEARRFELEADEVLFQHVNSLIENAYAPNPEVATLARTGIDAAYDRFEEQLSGKEYLADQFTYADVALIAAHYFAVFMGAELAPSHERLNHWRRRVSARSSVNRVLSSLSEFLTANGLNAPAFLA